MKLSIITVNLNNRDGLKRTIDSVVSQTFRDFEWIVIDGGSTDGSKELIEEYADHFSYWCSEPDKGIYNAMNKGVAHAKGEYCQFLNSGDWLYCSSTLLDIFISPVYGDILFGDLQTTQNGFNERTIHYPDNLSFENLVNKAIAHPSSFIRRELLVKTPYNENYRIVSDWEFFIKMALENKSFVHIPSIISFFDLSGVSASASDLAEEERNNVLSSILPKTLYYGCKEHLCRDRDYEIGGISDIIAFQKRSRLFRKLISIEVSIIKKMTSLWRA